jgi:hypothetical protein
MVASDGEGIQKQRKGIMKKDWFGLRDSECLSGNYSAARIDQALGEKTQIFEYSKQKLDGASARLRFPAVW